MSFQLSKNQVTFNKGAKPLSIRNAQREAWDIYQHLCNQGAPRTRATAKAFFLDKALGSLQDTVLKTTPNYVSILESAAQAYTAIGDSLMTKKMYSMNLYIKTDDLPLYKGLSEDLLATLRASGLEEFMFMARES